MKVAFGKKVADDVKSGRFFAYFGLMFGLVAIDLLTKALADAYSVKMKLIPGFLELRMCYNTGSAFSFLAGKEWAQTFFIVLTCVVCAVLLVVYFLISPKKKLARLAIAFLVGGAAGNFVDRVALHHVRDFVDFPFFAVCNFADFFITAGCVLLFVHLLFADEDALFRSGKEKNE